MLTQYTSNDSSVKHTSSNCYFVNIFQNSRSWIPESSTVSYKNNKISQTTWVHFYCNIQHIFNYCLYTCNHFLTNAFLIRFSACYQLLWPDSTKWHALSLSSWVLWKACCLMGTKPLQGQVYTTCNKWLAIAKLSKTWSSWKINVLWRHHNL